MKTESWTDTQSQKLSASPSYVKDQIAAALSAWSWISENTESSDNVKGALGSRMFSVNRLLKSTSFTKNTKAYLNQILSLLERTSVVSAPFEVKGKGRPREVRYLLDNWNVADLDANEEEQTAERLFDCLYELLSPVPEIQIEVKPLRILKDYFFIWSQSSFNLKAGQIVEDYMLCKHLLESGAPVAPVEETDKAQCPTCLHFFNVSENFTSEALLILSDGKFWYQNVLLEQKKGDLVTDFHLMQFLRESDHQVERPRDGQCAKCPKCETVALTEKLLGDTIDQINVKRFAQS